MKSVIAAWNSFWFTETSPAPLCLFRIAFGVLLLCGGILYLPEALTWFGDRGILSWQTAQQYTGNSRFSLFGIFGPGDLVVYVSILIYMLASVSLCLGFKPRISAAIVFMILTTLHHRNPAAMNSGDTLLRIMAFLMIFAPSGAMYAVGAKNTSADPPLLEPWAQRLIQLQVTAVYAQTVLAKLTGETWQNGTALYYASRLEELYRLPVPFLFDNIITINIFTWGTLVVEALLATLIWAKPPLRYYVLALGTLLHLGIEWSMNIPLFEWVMIYAYILFVEPKDVESFVSKVRAKFGPKLAKDAAPAT